MKTLSSVLRLLGSLASTLSALAADSSPMIPLTEFPRGHSYHGESGGLYGSGSNQPPPALLRAALDRATLVRPLDAEGRPASNGRVGLIAIGMSNTSQEFSSFQRLVSNDRTRNPQVVLVNGAQGGMDSGDWAAPESRLRRDQPSPWDQLLTRIKAAGLTAVQVQVAWISHARRRPEDLGDFPAHAKKLEEDLRVITIEAARRFPNLQLIYLSSRNYAGYAKNRLNPEPFAYESAFAVRRLVLDAANGRAGQPVMLWGAYTWAAGITPRADGLTWLPADFNVKDGTHPSESGTAKTSKLLLNFLRNDPTSRRWWNDGSTK